MVISMHSMAVDGFVPMLESLSAILDKGAAHAADKQLDLINARLAPDMYTLAQQVQQACYFADDGVSRLIGEKPPATENNEKTIDDLKTRIARTIERIRAVNVTAFEGAEDRDCSIPIENDMIISMNGLLFLRAWALAHFYFHLVTAYDILRHVGVAIGKRDYLSQVGGFIQPRG
jgi:uncharacterized protein